MLGGGAMGVGNLRWQYPRLTRSSLRCPGVSKQGGSSETEGSNNSNIAKKLVEPRKPFCGDLALTQCTVGCLTQLGVVLTFISCLFLSRPPSQKAVRDIQFSSVGDTGHEAAAHVFRFSHAAFAGAVAVM
jgi:hypothetical protein